MALPDYTAQDATTYKTNIDASLAAIGFSSGQFTPTIQDSSFSDAEGQTYSAQVGEYTVIGNRVFFHGIIIISSLGTLTVGDPAYIAGLPFTTKSGSTNIPPVHVGYGNSLALPVAGQNVSGSIDPGSDRIIMRLWDLVGGTSPMLISELSVNGELSFSGSYTTS